MKNVTIGNEAVTTIVKDNGDPLGAFAVTLTGPGQLLSDLVTIPQRARWAYLQPRSSDIFYTDLPTDVASSNGDGFGIKIQTGVLFPVFNLSKVKLAGVGTVAVSFYS